MSSNIKENNGNQTSLDPILRLLGLFGIWVANIGCNIFVSHRFYPSKGSGSNNHMNLSHFYFGQILGAFGLALCFWGFFQIYPFENSWRPFVATVMIYFLGTGFIGKFLRGFLEIHVESPDSLKDINVYSIEVGFNFVTFWVALCADLLPSYEALAVVYVAISLASLTLWCADITLGIHSGRIIGMKGWCFSLAHFTWRLLSFLVRLSLLILLVSPPTFFRDLQQQKCLVGVFLLSGVVDLYGVSGEVKTDIYRIDSQRTWMQFSRMTIYNIICFLLVEYRAVWLLFLMSPSVFMAAVHSTPIKLCLQILSVLNTIALLSHMLVKRHSEEYERKARDERRMEVSSSISSSVRSVDHGERSDYTLVAGREVEAGVEMAPSALVPVAEACDLVGQVEGEVESFNVAQVLNVV